MQDTSDIRDIVLQSYILEILRELKTPKRFNALIKLIRTRRTLTTKLSQLRKFGLIEITPIIVKDKYVNAYIISEKGKRIVRLLEKMN